MKKLLFLFAMTTSFCFAQNTLHYNDEKGSEKATLKDIEWLAGNWTGEAFGGTFQENWSKPLGGSMLFNFKLVVDGKVVFYELGHIVEKDKTLLYQIKHFDANLKGWEEKDERLQAQLVKIEENKVYFEDFTFEKVTENELNIYVVFTNDTGHEEEMKFNYKLKK